MSRNLASEYTKTYTTFSGCDIVATFGDKVIGELQAITYSVSREKAPVYTMGSAEPRSFSRGKRGIAGTIVFTVFDRDALIEAMKETGTITRIGTPETLAREHTDPMSIHEWDSLMSEQVPDDRADLPGALTQEEQEPHYADEVPPFDITITFANEYGQKATMVIYAVEILNEGTGFSIDSVTSEKACTFVARRIDPMTDSTREDSSEGHSVDSDKY